MTIMPCTDAELKEDLIKRILQEHTIYSKELVERAINACCKENAENILICSMERSRKLYLNELNINNN